MTLTLGDIAAIVTLLVPLGAGIGHVMYSMYSIRNNDIVHLAEDVRDVRSDVGKIDARLDRHIEWHAEKH